MGWPRSTSSRQFQGEVVAIEKPLRIATTRASLLRVITEELKGRSRELALQVVELSSEEVPKAVAGDPWANKLTVAQALVEYGFPELRSKLPKPPKRAALGFRPGEKYWLHMFDALAVGVTVREMERAGIFHVTSGRCRVTIIRPEPGHLLRITCDRPASHAYRAMLIALLSTYNGSGCGIPVLSDPEYGLKIPPGRAHVPGFDCRR